VAHSNDTTKPSFVDSEPPIGSILVFVFVFIALFIGMAFEFSGLRARDTEKAQVPADTAALMAVEAAAAEAMDGSRLAAAMEQVVGDKALLEGIVSDEALVVAADEDPLVTKGRELYASKTCIACHSLDGAAGVGPTWKDVWGTQRELVAGGPATFDDEYVRESITAPMAKVSKGFAPAMPVLPIDDLEMDALVAFIKAQTPADADAEPDDGAAPE
jgi:mono/diheme cytochrome c family protein